MVVNKYLDTSTTSISELYDSPQMVVTIDGYEYTAITSRSYSFKTTTPTKIVGNGFDYGAIVNYLFALALFIEKITENRHFFEFFLFLYISLNFLIFVFNRNVTIKKVSEILFLGTYVVFFMYHMMLMNNSPFVWLVYIIAFGSDTFAYFTGKVCKCI